MQDVAASDFALASRACAGEVEALAGLLARYRPSLYAAATRMLRDRDDAQDAVQEACVVALVRLPSLRDRAAVGGWLHAVLRNVCLMRLRRTGREVPNAELDVPTAVPGPEDVLDQLLLRDWVWDAVHALSPDDRVTVMLRYFTRCHSYEAIAAVLGVPVGTVRSRLHRARSQLTGALGRTLIAIEKGYEGRRGRTWIQLTKAGRRALNEEITALKTLIHQFDHGQTCEPPPPPSM